MDTQNENSSDFTSLETVHTITSREAAKLIWDAVEGEVFGCSFVKRSDGTLREGRFRLGPTVQKGLKGGPAAYNFQEKDLIPVYRMAGDKSDSLGERRAIPVEGIVALAIGGQKYSVR